MSEPVSTAAAGEVLADFRLSPRLRRTLGALARVICTDEIEELGLTQPILDHMELTLRSVPRGIRLGLIAGTWLFELAALFTDGGRFSRLDPARQERCFGRWWHSRLFPIRQYAKGVKSVIALAYWEHPEILSRLEYHPERWIAEVAARRLAKHAEEIRRQDAMVVAPDPLRKPAPREATPTRRMSEANER